MRRHLWWTLGLALVLAGVAVALTSRASPADFGWFAYAPASSDADWFMGVGGPASSGSALIVSRAQAAGLAVTTLGLLALAAGAGFRLGRRRS